MIESFHGILLVHRLTLTGAGQGIIQDLCEWENGRQKGLDSVVNLKEKVSFCKNRKKQGKVPQA